MSAILVTFEVSQALTSTVLIHEQFLKADDMSVIFEVCHVLTLMSYSDEQPLKIPEIEDTDEVSRFPPNEIDVQFVISLNIFELSEFAVMMPEVGTTEIS